MKDELGKISLGGVEYPLAFNINVIEKIQVEYKSLSDWGNVAGANEDGVDVRAVMFGLVEMINEGLDIENEETGGDRPAVTARWLGRRLDVADLVVATEAMMELVKASTEEEDDASKNA